MSKIHQLKTNFVAGELDPRLLSRSDIKHYYNGAERMRNAISIPQGGARIRPGSRYIWTVPDLPDGTISNVRLAEFQFNTEQTYLVVFHHLTITILRHGAVVASIASPYTSADLVAQETANGDLISTGIYWAQAKDTMLIFHENHQPRQLRRQGSHTAWSLSPFAFKNLPRYDYGEAYTGDNAGVNEVQYLHFPDYSGGEWTEGDTFALIVEDETTKNISFTATEATLAARIQAALRALPNISDAGLTVTHSGPGRTFTVTFGGDNGQRPWGSIYYTVKSSVNTVAINAVVLQEGKRPGEPVWSGARGWPRCGMFQGGRLWVAGTKSLPHYVWASRVGDERDFNTKLTRDDYAIAVAADTTEVPAFTACYPGRHLQFFSRGGEFYVPSSDREPVTPGNMALRRTTSRGIKAGLRVFEVDGATHFVQLRGAALRELIFADVEQAYQANNISLLAPHLMKDPVDFALRRSTSTTDADFEFLPNADGTMTVFCTLRTQEVNAFALWATQGNYRAAVAVLDEVYFGVQRTVGGKQFMMIERMDESLHVDCGLSGGASASAALAHLAGQPIEHALDGIPQGPIEAAGDGLVQFTRPAMTNWQAGLRFKPADPDYPNLTWLVKTLPIELQARDGDVMGRKRRVVQINVRLHETTALTINGTDLSFQDFGPDILNQGIKPFTGIREMRGLLGWDSAGSVVIGGNKPMRSEVLALNFGVSV